MAEETLSRWRSSWLDAAAFALGLGVAWFANWQTTDLVWSLWLSSFVVGYATIVWTILRPGVAIVRGIIREPRAMGDEYGKIALGGVVLVGAGVFMLAFFTVHFGGFHFVHSIFLHQFFPIHSGVETEAADHAFFNWERYGEVLRRYWWFLPAAFIAERAGFKPLDNAPPTSADSAVTVEAIARRKAAQARGENPVGDAFSAPYRNVIRLHLLIFFFAGAHLLKLDHFAIYAVVYATYFFPWRILRRQADAAPTPPTTA